MNQEKHERFASFKQLSRRKFLQSFSYLSSCRLSQCLKEAKEKAKEKGK